MSKMTIRFDVHPGITVEEIADKLHRAIDAFGVTVAAEVEEDTDVFLDRLDAYDPDQPRDEQGRWGEGGGDSGGKGGERDPADRAAGRAGIRRASAATMGAAPVGRSGQGARAAARAAARTPEQNKAREEDQRAREAFARELAGVRQGAVQEIQAESRAAREAEAKQRETASKGAAPKSEKEILAAEGGRFGSSGGGPREARGPKGGPARGGGASSAALIMSGGGIPVQATSSSPSDVRAKFERVAAMDGRAAAVERAQAQLAGIAIGAPELRGDDNPQIQGLRAFIAGRDSDPEAVEAKARHASEQHAKAAAEADRAAWDEKVYPIEGAAMEIDYYLPADAGAAGSETLKISNGKDHMIIEHATSDVLEATNLADAKKFAKAADSKVRVKPARASKAERAERQRAADAADEKKQADRTEKPGDGRAFASGIARGEAAAARAAGVKSSAPIAKDPDEAKTFASGIDRGEAARARYEKAQRGGR